MSTTEERRRYFRIDDSLHLSLTPVVAADLDRCLAGLGHREADDFTLMTALGAIGQQAAAGLHRIELRDPDLAEQLRALDRKLDLIARALVAKGVDLTDRPTRAVNLSAGGMALQGRDPYAPGQVLEIRMLLLPSYVGILAYGTVVECAPVDGPGADPAYPYRLRVDFSFMCETDRDALSRHVLLKQAEWLRRQRARPEAEGPDGA